MLSREAAATAITLVQAHDESATMIVLTAPRGVGAASISWSPSSRAGAADADPEQQDPADPGFR